MSRLARWLPPAAVALALVALDVGRLTAPFGPSHDGFNAALYMTGGRAIAEDGLLASRLGAVSVTRFGDRVVYAHHPPLVYLADAATYVAPGLGPVELRARLPAVLAALLLLAAVVLLLERCDVAPGPAGLGLLVAFATPMFFVFGVMTEPHVMGLAASAVLALLWERARRSERVSLAALGAVAALGALTSWQAVLFAALAGGALLLERRRGAAVAVLAGTALGVALTWGWVLWTYGGNAAEFVGRIMHRAGLEGGDAVGFRTMVRQQMGYLRADFPAGGWLVVPVAALGLLDRHLRPLVAVSLGTVLAYALVFRNGAYDHSYWLYGLLLPLALGAAAAAAMISRRLADRPALRFAGAVLGLGLAGILAATLWRPSVDELQNRIGARIGEQARALAWPAGQRYAWNDFGGHGTTDLLPWLRFYARREPFGVAGPQMVPQGQVMLRLAAGRLLVVPGAERRPATRP